MDSLYPSEQSGYMKGLVLGIREDLDPEQFQQFSRLGLTHILAISGLHVAVFIYALSGLLRFARMTRERMLLLLILLVPLYVLLSGASPSVIRAGLMSVLGLLAARMGKLKDGLHLLAAAALFMLIIDPFLIENVSFQLSFIVTIGLIVGVPPVRQVMPQWRSGKALLDLAAVTVVAQLVSFPVSIYYFNQFHALSLLANFILVPFISFIVMPLGGIALFIAIPWEAGGKIIAFASHYANDWTFRLVQSLSQVDALRMIWATPPLWWVAAWLCWLGVVFYLFRRWSEQTRAIHAQAIDAADVTAPMGMLERMESPNGAGSSASATHQFVEEDPMKQELLLGLARLKLWLLGLTLVGGLLLAYAYKPDLFDHAAVVNVLDVGQGDAIHIRTPSGKHMLIDGGGTLSYRKPGEEWKERSDPFEVGRKVIVPLLMKRGVREIDLLIISHLDSDHIRGLQAVLESIPVRRIWWNGTFKRSEDVQKLLRTALDLDIPLYSVYAGMSYELDHNTLLNVIWPSPDSTASNKVAILKDQNEGSIVLSVHLYDIPFLFAGDISESTELNIIRQQQQVIADEKNNRSSHSIMKVSHHGSRFSTSAAWLRFWKPLGAVASVGATNSYGHPHPDVLARLAASNTAVWRTDLDGEVRFAVTSSGLFTYIKK